MRDNDIRIVVEKELDWEPSINPRGIGVTVSDGVVTLRGDVDSYPQRHEAERAAGRVRGVKALVNHLEVRVPGAFERSDEDIARAAASAILWNTQVPVGSVRISVEKGRVKLEGIVDYQFQRQSADRSVRYLTGVRDVNNHIVVKPHADRRLVKADIEAALVRNAELDAHEIRVDTSTDQVILRGTVPSWRQREEAERAAWASPGVCHVENKIIVGSRKSAEFEEAQMLESRAI
jgi:osmotically-inducible protein OsmY